MPEQSSRFTLALGRWYAVEIIGDEFADEGLQSHSSIWVDTLTTLGGALRQFELHFYHLNYPEGVRSKQYTLQTLKRASSYLLARSTDRDPARIFLVSEISWEWMEKHYRALPNGRRPDIQAWLDSLP